MVGLTRLAPARFLDGSELNNCKVEAKNWKKTISWALTLGLFLLVLYLQILHWIKYIKPSG